MEVWLLIMVVVHGDRVLGLCVLVGLLLLEVEEWQLAGEGCPGKADGGDGFEGEAWHSNYKFIIINSVNTYLEL